MVIFRACWAIFGCFAQHLFTVAGREVRAACITDPIHSFAFGLPSDYFFGNHSYTLLYVLSIASEDLKYFHQDVVSAEPSASGPMVAVW